MTVINRFEGDPRLILGPDGSTIEYKGGQPVMDQGLENQLLIDLFTLDQDQTTGAEWWGNLTFPDPLEQIGSSYVRDVINEPLTLNGLANIEQSAGKALTDPIYGEITSDVTNPESTRINNIVRVSSPGNDVEILATTTNSVNWKAQANEPAYRNLTE